VAGESFTKTRGESTSEAKAYHEGMLAGQKLGEQEGRVKERALLLDQLEQRYMGETVERDSPLGDAILKIAREIAQYYREHPLGGGA
jgi:hypothetical protein